MPSQRTVFLIPLCVCIILVLTATAASAEPPTPGNFDGSATGRRTIGRFKNAAEVGFPDYRIGRNGNYQLLPSSRFKRAGSDQKDLGTDLEAIREATRDVS
jgi:hypothetical protein